MRSFRGLAVALAISLAIYLGIAIMLFLMLTNAHAEAWSPDCYGSGRIDSECQAGWGPLSPDALAVYTVEIPPAEETNED